MEQPPADTLAIPLDLDYIMGRFDPSKHPDFVLIDPQYADKTGMYLRKDTYKAFLEMYEHAKKDGIQLKIKSATEISMPRNLFGKPNGLARARLKAVKTWQRPLLIQRKGR